MKNINVRYEKEDLKQDQMTRKSQHVFIQDVRKNENSQLFLVFCSPVQAHFTFTLVWNEHKCVEVTIRHMSRMFSRAILKFIAKCVIHTFFSSFFFFLSERLFFFFFFESNQYSWAHCESSAVKRSRYLFFSDRLHTKVFLFSSQEIAMKLRDSDGQR